MKKVKISYVEENYKYAIIWGILSTIFLFATNISNNKTQDKIIWILFFLVTLGLSIYYFIKTTKIINKKNQIKKSKIKVQGKVINIIQTNGMIKSAIKGMSDDELATSMGNIGGIGNHKNRAFYNGDLDCYHKLVIQYINPVNNNVESFATPYIHYCPKNWENLQCDVYIDDKGIYADNYTTSM